MLPMLAYQQASLLNPSTASDHRRGMWIPRCRSSCNSCHSASAMEELAPFQGVFPEAKDGEERFQGDQQGQLGLEGKAQPGETPAEAEHGEVFKQQVTLHENRKNTAKWERCDPAWWLKSPGFTSANLKFARAPSCYCFGHQRAPVFQQY